MTDSTNESPKINPDLEKAILALKDIVYLQEMKKYKKEIDDIFNTDPIMIQFSKLIEDGEFEKINSQHVNALEKILFQFT